MPHRVVPKPRVCELCNKKFKGPGKGYTCEMGVNEGDKHVVEAKKYYSASGGLLLQWKTDQTIPDTSGGGRNLHIPGKSAQFINGVFSTKDPEEQDFLDDYPGCITYEQWYELFVPEKMRAEQTKRENEHNKVVVKQQNEELRELRKKLGLDPDTGKPVAKE